MSEQMIIDEDLEQEEKRSYAEQSKRISESIARTKTMIDNVIKDKAVSEILAGKGYDEAAMKEGLELQQQASLAFQQRARAISHQRMCTATLRGKEETARQMIADFRLSARALYQDQAALSALSMIDHVPVERSQFLNISRASIKGARQEPYAARFARYGYDTAMLDQITNALDELDDADSTQNLAIKAAVESTEARDLAHERMDDWVKQFTKIATAALRHDPELLKVLEV